ncbi:sigma factor [Paludibaculum fermentans]|uniref:RNA polymerase sigma-70 region 2 domain-containing protein n=1 Tax=Paludibaculum fermentans TaxID=1473598 RepID=A0A7S7SKY9_PALFE|nr:sigma factor [Paludibaculum fermentans]QOY87906.1 hypothetical protein IRI77_35090 [Paludibaculum fermentans]
MDELLHPYLSASGQASEDEHLKELVSTWAAPIIRRTVSSRLSGLWEDLEDVCSEAHLELLLHLRRIKARPGALEIDDFSAYVGTLARNACHHYFRRRRPGRARLIAQIRCLLREPEFRTWPGQGTTLCALSTWSQDLPPASTGAHFRGVEGHADLGRLLTGILETAGGPIPFQVLVDSVASVWKVTGDQETVQAGEELDLYPAASQAAEITIDRRRYTENLWREIRQLPRLQRVALLMNLRDGRGNSVLSMFPLSGVATFAEMASVLEMSELQLAELWIELPWNDNTIAAFLCCSRQQVINLRMAAKKRLSNRLGALPA